MKKVYGAVYGVTFVCKLSPGWMVYVLTNSFGQFLAALTLLLMRHKISIAVVFGFLFLKL